MRLRTAILLMTAVLVACAAAAQDSWSARTGAGEYAFARGDFVRAEVEFRAALEIAQRFPAGDRRLETSLENLARLYEHQSDFDRAQPMYELLLAAKEARLGIDHPALLSTLYAVARVSQPTGDLPTVVDSLQRFDAIAEASGEANPRQHWQALQMLARMQTVQERPDQALTWQRRAAQVIGRDPAATLDERIAVLESLAELELVAENGPTAERIYDEIAELREQEHIDGATPRTMAKGAETALAAAEFDTAERLAMRALEASPDGAAELQAREALAEISWIKVNRGTDDMAALLAAATDNDDLALASERLQALLTIEPGDHTTTLSRLVQVEALRGKPSSAADWQLRLLEAVDEDPAATAAVRRDLVTLLAAAGRYQEALSENAATLLELETRYGVTDERLLPILNQRLELYESAGNKKEAKKVRKRMKKIAR